MMTFAPLPAWSDLGAALFGAGRPDEEVIARPWCPPGRAALWFSRGAFALRAIARRRAMEIGRAPVFWLPDYFCNQSTAPLRADGVRLVFYPTSEMLTVAWPPQLPQPAPTPDLVMVVHHFGMPAETAAPLAFARGAGAILIEDAAHALVPGNRIGNVGDFILYCPRKTLAVPDGAVIVAPPANVAALMPASRGAAPSPFPWLIKRVIQRSCPPGLTAAWTRARLQGFDVDPVFAALPETPAPSPTAKRLIAHAIPRLAEEAATRHDNWRILAESVDGREDIRPLWKSELWLKNSAAPYRFVLRACDPMTAASLYERLRGESVPVETWPDLAPEVLAMPEHHCGAIALRRTLLLLPLHGGIDIGTLVERLRRALN